MAKKLPRVSPSATKYRGLTILDAYPTATMARSYAADARRSCPDTGRPGRAAAVDLGPDAGRLRYAVFVRCR
jgi:hypothetical protein